MTENSISNLVKKAKGDDRSLRQYAQDSGVNQAIISRIINGTYIPKKPDVYEKLTSLKADPRGGVTYEQMILALNSSQSYQKGIVAGKAISAAAVMAMGMIPIAGLPFAVAMSAGLGLATVSTERNSSKTEDSDKAEEVVNEIRRFVATSNGLIFSALAVSGIFVHIEGERHAELENIFDKYLKLDNQEVNEYIIRYAYIAKEYQKIPEICENVSRRMIEELIFIKPSRKRKVTIITNSMKAFDYMLSYKNRLSYNGDLSIILVDTERAELKREEYISHYVGKDERNEMIIVHREEEL